MMATFQAIGSVAEAVARLLGQTWQPSLLNGSALQFEVYQGKDFSTAGPWTSACRSSCTRSASTRCSAPCRLLDPQHRRPLPLDIWLLLTAWAQDASMEHAILGWAMRAIDDNPILSSGFLNAFIPGVFRPEETVELVPAELTNAEVFQLWQVLPNSLQLSVTLRGPRRAGGVRADGAPGLAGPHARARVRDGAGMNILETTAIVPRSVCSSPTRLAAPPWRRAGGHRLARRRPGAARMAVQSPISTIMGFGRLPGLPPTSRPSPRLP